MDMNDNSRLSVEDRDIAQRGSYLRGLKTVAIDCIKINGHVGWLHQTEDGQQWFIPDDVAQSIHVSSHDCGGDCKAGNEASSRGVERRAKDRV